MPLCSCLRRAKDDGYAPLGSGSAPDSYGTLRLTEANENAPIAATAAASTKRTRRRRGRSGARSGTNDDDDDQYAAPVAAPAFGTLPQERAAAAASSSSWRDRRKTRKAERAQQAAAASAAHAAPSQWNDGRSDGADGDQDESSTSQAPSDDDGEVAMAMAGQPGEYMEVTTVAYKARAAAEDDFSDVAMRTTDPAGHTELGTERRGFAQLPDQEQPLRERILAAVGRRCAPDLCWLLAKLLPAQASLTNWRFDLTSGRFAIGLMNEMRGTIFDVGDRGMRLARGAKVLYDSVVEGVLSEHLIEFSDGCVSLRKSPFDISIQSIRLIGEHFIFNNRKMRVSRVKDTLVQIKFKEAGSRYRALSVSTLAERDAEMPADIPAGMTDDETDSAATSATDDPDAEMASLLDGLVAGNALLDEQLFPGLGNGGEDDGEEDHGAGRSDAPFYAGWLLKAPGSQQLGPKKRRLWKKRWFVLHNSRAVLLYYKTPKAAKKGGKPRGFVDLRECFAIDRIDLEHKNRGNVFGIKMATSATVLSAPTESIRWEWIQRCHQAIFEDESAPGSGLEDVASAAESGPLVAPALSDVLSESDIEIEGYLKKAPRTRVRGKLGWKRRWFVLPRQSCLLLVYHSRDEAKAGEAPSDTIDLSSCTREIAQVGGKGSSSKAFLLSVPTLLREYMLAADTQEELYCWVAVLEKARVSATVG